MTASSVILLFFVAHDEEGGTVRWCIHSESKGSRFKSQWWARLGFGIHSRYQAPFDLPIKCSKRIEWWTLGNGFTSLGQSWPWVVKWLEKVLFVISWKWSKFKNVISKLSSFCFDLKIILSLCGFFLVSFRRMSEILGSLPWPWSCAVKFRTSLFLNILFVIL